jgi:NAD(P)-dependent dehydrogenase (short-subunit alcohol dehydrogenase family)
MLKALDNALGLFNSYGQDFRNMNDLSGRVAIVTGARAGIGRAIALRLAGSGAGVGLFDIDEAGARKTADQVRALGKRASVAIASLPDLATRTKALPLRRPGYPNEVADVIVFLA